ETGLEVQRQAYDTGVNILAIQEGTTNPERWIVLSAHYDTIAPTADQPVGIGPTIYGAWDDGSGTATLMELAQTLGQGEFPFTVVYAFFDGEEKGLRGSAAFVEKMLDTEGVELVANLNMDPPGLNWPCGDQAGPFPVKIIHEMEKVEAGELPRYAWLHQAVEHALAETGVPDEVRDYTAGIPVASTAVTGVTGTSDHASFGRLDIANVFIGGTPSTIVGGDPNDHLVAGMTYPLHTPLDTLEAMEARCLTGSLVEGLQTTVDIMAHALTWMAANPAP
ncbi:MAG: M20/M25/M40 family metallo-hydrolase, partial [Candidatus Thermoplasmatota archaeon]|nr:M20/M25/M40 family metallo-hydrolase [Candidatus Thermoplasmatota archaeon]